MANDKKIEENRKIMVTINQRSTPLSTKKRWNL